MGCWLQSDGIKHLTFSKLCLSCTASHAAPRRLVAEQPHVLPLPLLPLGAPPTWLWKRRNTDLCA